MREKRIDLVSKKLKRCPFCDGKAVKETGHDISGLRKVRIKCNKCLIRTLEISYWEGQSKKSAEEKVEKFWNTRASGAKE